MKHNQNVGTILFLQPFTKSQHGKNIERTFLVKAGAQKGWETVGFGNTLPQYLPNPKNKFPVKFIYTWSIFAFLSTGKKTKTISIKEFLR